MKSLKLRSIMRDLFPFSIDCNVPLNIYHKSIGSGMLSFTKNTLDINTFVILPNRLLKRMKKQGSKR